jgi:hypothetical protein
VKSHKLEEETDKISKTKAEEGIEIHQITNKVIAEEISTTHRKDLGVIEEIETIIEMKVKTKVEDHITMEISTTIVIEVEEVE